jgi:2-C-methyl-D-erythritol 4-phosphate cytidylyltransferase
MDGIDVIYLTAGFGIRANLGYPKQYAYIGGKPILVHGLETLNKIQTIKNFIIVAEDIAKVAGIVNPYNISNFSIIDGGMTRQESVYKGLKKVTSENVLIAESVRPFISTAFVENIINTKGKHVIPYARLNSTPFTLSGNILNRDEIVCVQTPQKYLSRELRESHEFAVKQNIENTTDDLDLMKRVGICSGYEYIEGPIENIKITYPIDLKIAEAIYNYKNCIDE